MDNCRLFVGGIPKTKKKDEIMEEMKKVTEGVVDVIVYPSAADKTKPGFYYVIPGINGPATFGPRLRMFQLTVICPLVVQIDTSD